MAAEPTVFIVDDDDAVREGLQLLMDTAGLRAETYPSAQAFLDGYQPERPGCLVLDLRMPGIGGLDLQERMAAEGIDLPVIVLTAYGDVPAAVRALKSGAVDFLEKPFDGELLLERIHQAIARDRENRRESEQRAAITKRLEQLTPRERQVLELIIAGKANKVVAVELGISERTVELHRSRIMKKVKARSLAELMHMVFYARGEERPA